MSKESKTKIKRKTNINTDSLMSEIKKGFKLVDEKYGKLSFEMKEGFNLVDEKFNLVDKKIDDLAIATKIGFDGTATKGDMLERFGEVNQRFDMVDSRLDSVDERLDGIETFLLDDHRRRIEKLEIEVTELREVLSLNK